MTPALSTAPLRAIAQFAGPVAGILKGIRWAGLAGSQGATEAIAKETKRIAYEIKQTLGIKGFVLNLTGSAALSAGLPACWDAVRPCMETPELEDATAQILSEASRLAEDLGGTNHKSLVRLSHDEAAQLQVGLDFYRFLLPKMLVLTSALRLACDQELIKRGNIEGCAPQKTVVREDGLHQLLQSIMGILSVAQEKGTTAMPKPWTNYLAAASAQLKPMVQGENFHRASDQLHRISCQLASTFQERIGTLELDGLVAIAKQVARFETLLPSLIISITWLELYLRPADSLLLARPLPLPTNSPANSATAPEGYAALQPTPSSDILCPA